MFRLVLVAALLCWGCSKKVTKVETQPVKIDAASVPSKGLFKTGKEAAAAPAAQWRDVELGAIYFDYDKSDLRIEATQRLNAIRAYLEKSPGVLHIEGHCDSRGSDEYNDALGLRRAQVAKEYVLGGSGLEEKRVRVVSYGKRQPEILGCENEECHKINRRDVFKVKEE